MTPNDSQPNILFILIDDMGWVDLEIQGSAFYETPHIDALARQGMSFSDAYAACPVCSPTRASLLTGKYPATVGITNYIPGNETGKLLSVPYLHQLPLEERTIARVLNENGYATWHVGKWHLGGEGFWPRDHGFDWSLGASSWGHPRKGYFSPYQMPNMPDGPDGEYLTDRLTDEAIRLIEDAPDEQPFFLNLWHYAVHTPLQAHDADIARFTIKAHALGLDTRESFEDGDFFPTDHQKQRRIRRRLFQSDPIYAAMLWNLDQNIGRLLHALDESGKADNTLVIFTSDNGGLATAEGSPTCNAPLAEGKGWIYEGGTREPLFVRWPGVIAPGSSCSTPVTSPDFFPTLCDAAGLSAERDAFPHDGESLLPLLRGTTNTLKRDAIFWHYPHYGNQGGTPGSSVRIGDYKLIEKFEDGRLELYNLRQDIGETHNLAAQQPERALAMQQRLAQWRASVEAKIPQPNPNFSG